MKEEVITMTEEEVQGELIKLDRHNLHLKQVVRFDTDKLNDVLDMLDLPENNLLIKRLKELN